MKKKEANRKLRKVGNLGKVIPSLLHSEFSILPCSQNQKLKFKNSEISGIFKVSKSQKHPPPSFLSSPP